MLSPHALRRVPRFALTAAAAVASAALGVAVGCGPDQSIAWICLDPTTGKESQIDYDRNHYVNGMFDPCNCYDPCGPAKTCPIVVDAGPPTLGCDAGDADAGDAGGG
jgi:hypothetical protein